MKDESQYVVVFDEAEEAFVGTLKDIQILLNEKDLPLAAVSIYRLGYKVKLALAVEEL